MNWGMKRIDFPEYPENKARLFNRLTCLPTPSRWPPIFSGLAILTILHTASGIATAADKYMIWEPDYLYADAPQWAISVNWSEHADGPYLDETLDVPAAYDNAFLWKGHQVDYNFNYPNASLLGNGPLGSLHIDYNSSLLHTSPYTLSIAGSLHLGEFATGTYTLTGGVLDIGGWAIIGESGTGYFQQQGGELRLSSSSADIYLGKENGSYGQYTLASGSLYSGWQYVGYLGTGRFIQSGGTNTAYSEFNVGTEPGSSGEYQLYGGILETTNAVIGNKSGSTGLFQQSGGTHIVSDFLNLGIDGPDGTFAAAEGTYTLSGTGILATPKLFVGGSGIGTFTQSGGTAYVGFNADGTAMPEGGLYELIVARNSGSLGSYTLSGGVLQTSRLVIGDAGGFGTFIQEGNSTAIVGREDSSPQDLIIGQDVASGATDPWGQYHLKNNASLTVKANMFLGDQGGNGYFNQTGNSTATVVGDLNIGSHSEFADPGLNSFGRYVMNGTSANLLVQSRLRLGNYEGSIGIFELREGAVEAYYTAVGEGGQGTIMQSGGTFYTGNVLAIGDGDNTVGGLYQLQNGILNAYSVRLGRQGIGVLAQTGGAATIDYLNIGGQRVTLPDETINYIGNGRYDLTGGSLVVNNNLNIGIVGTGKFTLQGTGDLTVGGDLNIGVQDGTGTYEQSASSATIAGNLNIANGSTAQLSGGSLHVNKLDNRGTFSWTGGTFTTDVVSDNFGIFAIVAGLTFDGNIVNATGGTIQGNGTIAGDLTNCGTVSPGASPGVLTITGNFVNLGTLLVEIGGPTNYDWLNVSGTATLEGILDVESWAGYTFKLGDSFAIVRAVQGITGSFTTITEYLPTLATGLAWNWGIFNSGSSASQEFRLYVTQGGEPVPEPSTIALFGLGLSALACLKKRSKPA